MNGYSDRSLRKVPTVGYRHQRPKPRINTIFLRLCWIDIHDCDLPDMSLFTGYLKGDG